MSAQSASPFVLYKNARFFTADKNNSWAEAMVIQGKKVLGLGQANQLREKFSIDREVDLLNKFVMPSFHDNHIHPIDSGTEIFDCNLYDVMTIEEFKNILKRCQQKKSSSRQWLRGSGWNFTLFKDEKKTPLEILDELNLNRPVVLTSSDGHSYLVNSEVLQIAKVSTTIKNTEQEEGIGRNSDGKLTGVFYENAMEHIDNILPKRKKQELIAGFLHAQNLMLSNGITSFKDAYVTEEYLKIYHELDMSNKLVTHASLALYADPKLGLGQIRNFLQLQKKYTSRNVQIKTVKVFLDGILEDKTAALLLPYVGSKKRGNLFWKTHNLNLFAKEVTKQGFQLHFHCIGDAAVRAAIQSIAYAAVNSSLSDKSLRHEISHLQLIHPQDWFEFSKLDISATFSPFWAGDQDNDNAKDYIGVQRVAWLYPMGAILKTGARLAFGSDWSVTTMNPWAGIQSAVMTKFTQQKMDLVSAIKAYTTASAEAVFREDVTGSLSVGKNADFVVLDKNPFLLNPNNLSSVKTLATYREGILIWDQRSSGAFNRQHRQ